MFCQNSILPNFANFACTVRQLAANVVAAWRQAGVLAKLGREQRMMLPALCQSNPHPRLRQTAR